MTANVARNIWAHSVIMCGHFPEGVETFEQESLDEDETKGEWYLRQMLGSANISGSRAMHLMSGNLSHQIEHHLFPDLPSSRYYEIAPRVREVFQRYGLSYHAAPLVTAGRQCLAQGGAALPAQRLAEGDDAEERAAPDRGAVPQGGLAGPESPRLRPAALIAASISTWNAPTTQRAPSPAERPANKVASSGFITSSTGLSGGRCRPASSSIT